MASSIGHTQTASILLSPSFCFLLQSFLMLEEEEEKVGENSVLKEKGNKTG